MKSYLVCYTFIHTFAVRMSLNFLFPLLVVSWFSGCAEKRTPDDELVRDYLYAVKPVELWHTDPEGRQTSLVQIENIFNEKFLRKFMRVSEMEESKFMPICIDVATKAVTDAGFFMNNSRGRKNFENFAALKAKSPDEYDKLIKERCNDSLQMIKGRANVRELKKRKNLIDTDNTS